MQVTSGHALDVTHGAAPAPGSTSPHQAGGRRPAFRRGLSRFRRRPPWSLIAGPAVTLALMLWGITAPAYWGDEADTVSAVSRSVPQLLQMLRHADAVHGLYYLLLWPVVRVLGTGELATRLPSAVAMAAAALGVAAIARRLASDRAALYAGLVFAALPVITAQGHDARPYGMITAAAVLASYLLIRAVDDPRRGWFAAYGVSLVLLAYLELFGLFLIAAQAVTLAGLCRRGLRGSASKLVRRWLVTVAVVGVAVLPLVAYGWQQRVQIAWIAKPSWHDVLSAAVSLAGGTAGLAAVIGLLALLGAMHGGTDAPVRLWRAWLPRLTGPRSGAGGQDRGLTWLAVPWLVLPPAMLLAASEIMPVYFFRYLVFCLPATALLAGAGLAALTRAAPAPSGGYPHAANSPGTARRPQDSANPVATPWPPGPRNSAPPGGHGRPQNHGGPDAHGSAGGAWGAGLRAWRRVPGWAVPAGVLALIVAVVTPTQLSSRVPGAGMRAVSQFLAVRERRGDAVIYPGSGVPPWYLAYPNGLGRLRDIWMAVSGPASGRLYGLRVSTPVLEQRERGVCRVWAAEMSPPWLNPAQYLPGFRLAGAWQPQPGVRLWLYAKPGCALAHGAGR